MVRHNDCCRLPASGFLQAPNRRVQPNEIILDRSTQRLSPRTVICRITGVEIVPQFVKQTVGADKNDGKKIPFLVCH